MDYAYDVRGRLVSVSGSASAEAPDGRTANYAYDSYGRVVGVETPEGTLHYAYDPVTGRRIRTWTDSGTETLYGYDNLNRLATVSSVENGGGLPVTNVTRYTYTAVGSRESVTLPNGVVTRYGYDDLNRLTSLAHFNEGGEMLGFYGYALAADGRRTQAYEILRNPGEASCSTNWVTYTYDNLNRLVHEVMEVPGAGTGYESEYTYDLAGQQKSAKPKAEPPGNRDFEAVTKWRSEEPYSATQRQLFPRLPPRVGRRADSDHKLHLRRQRPSASRGERHRAGLAGHLTLGHVACGAGRQPIAGG